jgi:hypothetical protein
MCGITGQVWSIACQTMPSEFHVRSNQIRSRILRDSVERRWDTNGTISFPVVETSRKKASGGVKLTGMHF